MVTVLCLIFAWSCRTIVLFYLSAGILNLFTSVALLEHSTTTWSQSVFFIFPACAQQIFVRNPTTINKELKLETSWTKLRNWNQLEFKTRNPNRVIVARQQSPWMTFAKQWGKRQKSNWAQMVWRPEKTTHHDAQPGQMNLRSTVIHQNDQLKTAPTFKA